VLVVTRAVDITRIKEAMLKQLDSTFRQNYHQSLSEVLNEFRMRSVLSLPDPSPDKVFSVILQTRVLTYKPVASVTRLREALERMATGKYGLCLRCGREIAEDVLLNDPSATWCRLCQEKPNC
jgi:RNA polymerase-binding transcription factor DksA